MRDFLGFFGADSIDCTVSIRFFVFKNIIIKITTYEPNFRSRLLSQKRAERAIHVLIQRTRAVIVSIVAVPKTAKCRYRGSWQIVFYVCSITHGRSTAAGPS